MEACNNGNMDVDVCADLLARYSDEIAIEYVHDDVKSLIKEGLIDLMIEHMDQLNVFPKPSHEITGNGHCKYTIQYSQ